MYGKMKDFLTKELADIREAGLYKEERIITTPQRADIEVKPEAEVLNFCANNYLGLSNNEQLIEGAVNAMKQRGYGMSSVRHTGHSQATRSRYQRLLPHRRHHSLLKLLRCQRRTV